MSRVLICDDSVAVHRSLGRYIKNEGAEVISVFTGEDAVDTLKKCHFDILILDVMLPGISGLDVCREVRKDDPATYIMMLSAKGEVVDRVVGLEVGADEYIAKPFSPKEVSIRIRKILDRLSLKQVHRELVFEGLTVDVDSYQAHFGNKQVELTPKEVSVLDSLISNVGKAVSRDWMLEHIWGYDYDGDVRAIDSLIKRLKKKLTDIGADINLKSIYGVGYRLDRKDS